MANGFSPTGNHLGVNLSYTKFLFIVPRAADDAAGTRLKNIGGLISRGFFNDFDADGTRDTQPHETIQFFVSDGDRLDDFSTVLRTGFPGALGATGIAEARYA